MKLLTQISLIVVFAPLMWAADTRSTYSSDFESADVQCEKYCPEIDDTAPDTGCSNSCLETTFEVTANEESYVDDIPFDTKKVVENVDLKQNDFESKKAEDDELTIFQLFIKWVALLFRLN